MEELDSLGKPINKISRKYVTELPGKWQTTFGFNMVRLNNETFFSEADGNGMFTITPSNRSAKWEYLPPIMFTWRGPTFCDDLGLQLGYSAGLGYDLEKSFSVFAGLSFIFSQNMTLTFGGDFINQQELNAKYASGDTIAQDLDFNQLHEDFLRIRPFLSLSLRLDKSPF